MKDNIKKLMNWIIANTNTLRNISVALAGALVGAGVIPPDGKEAVITGLFVLLTGAASYIVEDIKTKHVIQIQHDLITTGIDVKVDGYFGPKTAAAIRKAVNQE